MGSHIIIIINLSSGHFLNMLFDISSVFLIRHPEQETSDDGGTHHEPAIMMGFSGKHAYQLLCCLMVVICSWAVMFCQDYYVMDMLKINKDNFSKMR